MITVVVGMILVLFFFFVLVKGVVKQVLGVRLCALCVAVATTWMTLLVVDVVGFFVVDEVLLGVLMGESVTGVMYAVSGKRWLLKAPLTGLFVILAGTVGVYGLLTGVFEAVSFVLVVLVGVFEVVVRFGRGKAGGALVRRLERCCS